MKGKRPEISSERARHGRKSATLIQFAFARRTGTFLKLEKNLNGLLALRAAAIWTRRLYENSAETLKVIQPYPYSKRVGRTVV